MVFRGAPLFEMRGTLRARKMLHAEGRLSDREFVTSHCYRGENFTQYAEVIRTQCIGLRSACLWRSN
jgi:hypothetical protein